jgi:hypothetical protein
LQFQVKPPSPPPTTLHLHILTAASPPYWQSRELVVHAPVGGTVGQVPHAHMLLPPGPQVHVVVPYWQLRVPPPPGTVHTPLGSAAGQVEQVQL